MSDEGAGSRLLAWIGGVVTLAGVVLLLVLAVQRGYLGPLPRVLVGGALGATLVGIGLWLHRTEGGRVGARAVAATGFAGLYLDVVAATPIYSFLPTTAPGCSPGCSPGRGITVAARWDSQLFGIFVVLGCAVSAPVLTGGPTTLLTGFLLVLQIATTPTQLRKRWTVLAPAAGGPALLSVLALPAGPDAGDARTVLLLCVVTGAVQIVVAALTATRATDPALPVALLLAAPIPTLLGAVLVPGPLSAAVVAGLAMLLLAVAVLHGTGLLQVSEVLALAAAGASAVAGVEAICLAFGGDTRPAVLFGASVLLAVAAHRLRHLAALVAAVSFAGLAALLALAGPLEPYRLTHAPRVEVPTALSVAAMITGALAAVAAVSVALVASRLAPAEDQQAERLRWTFAGGLALYGASAAVLSAALVVTPDARGFLVGHVLVTVSWTLASLVLLLRHVDSTPLRVAGLVLVGAALGKLVLFDLGSLSGIPRVLAFLGAGLVLLAAGARYAALVAERTRPTH